MSRRWIELLGVSVSTAVLALAHARPAEACGGCFHGSKESGGSVVVGHRMALSVSPERTVLWDQVSYTGSPEDFAWVLPVGKGAKLELASDAWFEALDAMTATHVMSRTVQCPGGKTVRQVESGGSGSCGTYAPGAATPVEEQDPGTTLDHQGASRDVTVTHKETVGPYETVTLKASDGNSLSMWLTGHGYQIPADIAPVIQAYVDGGADFIALRLAPGIGVSQMQPVRVVTPGASPILPLRMVAAGAGPNVSLVLYLLGEGRYGPENFPSATVNASNFAWNWTEQSSNYPDLRQQVLSADSGRTWLTSFARPGALTATITAVDGQEAQYNVGADSYDNLADLYFAQAAFDEGKATACDVKAAAKSTSVVKEACDPMAGCGDSEIDAATLACDGHDDLAAALIGLHPNDVWITRIESLLPREALSIDLKLGAADQTVVPNWYTAQKDLNPPPCPKVQTTTQPTKSSTNYKSGRSSCVCDFAPAGGVPTSTLGMLSLAGWLAARRLRRRRRP
jgi:hypothetical protein